MQKWKFTQRGIEEIPEHVQRLFFYNSYLAYNVDKQFLIALHERSVQKLIESHIIRKSIFWIVGPFSRIASHMHIIIIWCNQVWAQKFNSLEIEKIEIP